MTDRATSVVTCKCYVLENIFAIKINKDAQNFKKYAGKINNFIKDWSSILMHSFLSRLTDIESNSDWTAEEFGGQTNLGDVVKMLVSHRHTAAQVRSVIAETSRDKLRQQKVNFVGV